MPNSCLRIQLILILVTKWFKLSKYRPLTKNFLDESATMYGQDPVTAVRPSESWWT